MDVGMKEYIWDAPHSGLQKLLVEKDVIVLCLDDGDAWFAPGWGVAVFGWRG